MVIYGNQEQQVFFSLNVGDKIRTDKYVPPK
jgi:hypothetical protein